MYLFIYTTWSPLKIQPKILFRSVYKLTRTHQEILSGALGTKYTKEYILKIFMGS